MDHDTVRVRVDGESRLTVPLLRLAGIVVLGRVSITPALIGRCAEDGRVLVWLSRSGRFLGRLEGPTRGNVYLRHAQHLALGDSDRQTAIARQMVAGKLQNTRHVLLRGIRDAKRPTQGEQLAAAATSVGDSLVRLKDTADLDVIRGLEGEAARVYFGVFNQLLGNDRQAFRISGRTRRPPRDPSNAVLSFLYALLSAECAGAAEGVGLDPQMGYLHTLRPGRPALAFDLMEELRAPLVDRLALTLINRRQLKPEHFEESPGGGVFLTETGRRVVIVAYQERKEVEVQHSVLKEKVPFGLVPHVQARLLARHLRGDLPYYLPFVYR